MGETKKRKSGMVRVRGGFSDVQGIAPCNTEIQMEEFDDVTRNKLCNILYNVLEVIFNDPNEVVDKPVNRDDFQLSFCKSIIGNVFCETYSQGIPAYCTWRDIYSRIQSVILESEYNEVLDVIQYVCQWVYSHIDKYRGVAYEVVNDVFEEEYVGYRFVDGRITPITNKEEIKTIEEACTNPFEGCRKQIQNAVGFLADREKKDYKNCIKESISAVESLCQVITGDKKATLNDALNKLEKAGLVIHPALKIAFQKLYAYTSDQGGIRHAEGMFESNVTFEEAKFMLVSCSAFINYLIAEYGKRSK